MYTNDHKKTLFHPQEVSFVGYSNTGKTTLLENLITRLSKEFKLSYVKHDAHNFSMDQPGKDTHRMKQAGASNVYINDPKHQAFICDDSYSYFRSKQMFLDSDFVLIEGFKKGPCPKVVILDQGCKILSEFNPRTLENIICFVGPWSEKPVHHKLNGFRQPYICRDDTEKVYQLVKKFMLKPTLSRPLYGLVLAGGESKRMKQDKAVLKYHDKPQMLHTHELLSTFVDQCFISARESQRDTNAYENTPVIYDRFLDMGPLGGILSAMQEHPEAAWLVIACDLPYLDESTITTLLKYRNPMKMATCYLSAEDHLPEPLCTIYEPKTQQRFFEALGLGLKCPRKVLINSATKDLRLGPQNTLANANHPEEYKLMKDQISVEKGLS